MSVLGIIIGDNMVKIRASTTIFFKDLLERAFNPVLNISEYYNLLFISELKYKVMPI